MTSPTVFKTRKRLAEYCFEKLGAQSVSFMKQASLHLFSECSANGIVVDFGAHTTQISPVCEGYTSQHCCKNYKIGGNQVDEYLQKILLGSYSSEVQESGFKILRDRTKKP